MVYETASVEYSFFDSCFNCFLTDNSSQVSCCCYCVGLFQFCFYVFLKSRSGY